MIKSIKLKFGRKPGSEPEQVEITPITVFVGPNYSGKSKILSELHRFCISGSVNTTDVILERIEFNSFSYELAQKKIEAVTLRPNYEEAITEGYIVVGKREQRLNVNKQKLLQALQNPNERAGLFCQWFLAYNTLILNGQNRIGLVSPKSAGDLQKAPENSLQTLFSDDDRRLEARRIIHDAFGLYLVVDPTNIGSGQLRLRLSKQPPASNSVERGLDKPSVDFHGSATPIEQASDGVKAFTGMITEIIAGDPSVLLIDEPEAFLYPPLAFKLGKEIGKLSAKSEKRLFVSTHSSHFLMGCVQSGAPLNIVRLTYRDNVATARVLPNQDILHLMRNPLLRSTGILEGIFYEFVVVTESDSDRAFYQEINERLLQYKPEFGIPNCLFINAQNKQTVKTIIKPLRELGIPTVGIVDVDIIKEGGTVWTTFLESGFIPQVEHNSLATLRAAIKQKFDAIDPTGKQMKTNGGVNLLSPDDKEAANNLFDKLGEYGLFVIRRGELESWLSELGVEARKAEWLIHIFEKMGEDPLSSSYIKPTEGDVWDFIGYIKSWLMNSSRKGIPS
jgi:ABC-type cobalamin/Fe3+-siderophores transport system ATPase subunit